MLAKWCLSGAEQSVECLRVGQGVGGREASLAGGEGREKTAGAPAPSCCPLPWPLELLSSVNWEHQAVAKHVPSCENSEVPVPHFQAQELDNYTNGPPSKIKAGVKGELTWFSQAIAGGGG